MKKLAFILAFMLMILSCMTSKAYELPETIKIGLFYGNTAKSDVVISCLAGATLSDSSELVVATANDFSFTVSEGSLCANDGVNSYILQGDAVICAVDDFIQVNSKKYRGQITLKVDKNGKITVINDVNIEEYLYGVLPHEMSTGFPYEALKAQAVCARTYAVNNIGRFSEHGFDLTDNTLSQVYGGIKSEAPDCTSAVDETKGMVVLYNGKLAETFYYASSSGETLDVKDVWGSTTYPYLISVPDTYQSVIYPNGYTWEVAYTQSEVTKLMNDKGFSLGTIKDITIDKTTPQGAVTSLTFVGERGSKTYTLGNTRTVLNLKSQVFKISKEYSRNEYKTTFLTSNGVTTSNNSGYVMSSDGIKKVDAQYAVSSTGISKVSPSFSEQAADKYVVYGSGYGHGIGMSQNGAKGMAKSGFTFDQILTHYFPGCTVEKIQEEIHAEITTI
ncbi:MAG: SpoIID/LytB domain-containing protein [Clostridia bacterium]|nr:SpoIID/LytB domain-containing protein [Clostridia bacterium]